MRVYGPTGSRSYPTDRSPSTVALGGTVGVVAGNTATAFTYTPPASRRATLTVSYDANVEVALGAGSRAVVEITVQPAAQGLTVVGGAEFPLASAINVERHDMGQVIELKAGDIVTGRVTVDAGAGTVRGKLGAEGVEFDA